jgi:hypothetical protein
MNQEAPGIVVIERRIDPAVLTRGSSQADVWGANYYPGQGPDDCIEYTALINIRPSQGNPSMEIQDAETRRHIREIAHALIGCGEELAR